LSENTINRRMRAKSESLRRRLGLAERQRMSWETWKDAVRALKREDHYLLVLLAAPTGSSDSLFVDRLKLVGTALLVCLLLLAGVFLFSSRK
jgi:hypothetical protein